MNTGTSDVASSDAGAASAMVNTGQQVGGSIGTSLLNTMAASAAASYLASHLSPRLMIDGHPAPALAELAQVHSYTTAMGCVRAGTDGERGGPSGVPNTRAPEWLAHPQGALLASQPVIGLERIGDAPARDFGSAQRPFDGIRVLSFTHAVAGPVVGRTLAEHGADVLSATRPNDYEHEFIYAEANLGSRSAYVDLGNPAGQERAAALLANAHIVVSNHRSGSLERHGLEPRRLAERYPGLVYVSLTCYGSDGPWAQRGGFDMNGSAASGLMTLEGTRAQPRLPVTGMINDYITGYLGAVGAAAALVKRATGGGLWHVTVNLTRTAMWCGSLGLVNPALAGCANEHRLREPASYDAPSPLGDVRILAPPVRFSATAPAWPAPPLVPRGSSRAEWLT